MGLSLDNLAEESIKTRFRIQAVFNFRATLSAKAQGPHIPFSELTEDAFALNASVVRERRVYGVLGKNETAY